MTAQQAAATLYRLLSGILTDDQLDFQPADGGPTIRQQLAELRPVMVAAAEQEALEALRSRALNMALDLCQGRHKNDYGDAFDADQIVKQAEYFVNFLQSGETE